MRQKRSCDAILGDTHPDTLITHHNLARALCGIGELDKAIELFDAIATIVMDTFSSESDFAGVFLGHYGECLTRKGLYEQAESKLVASYNILVNTVGEDSERTKNVVGFLVALYEAWEKTDQIEKWRSRL